MSRNHQQDDPRVRITATIWGCATGMLAICIPLTKATHGGVILPLAVLLGAGVSTAAVWRAPDQRRREELNHIRDLEQRIEALEVICSQAEFELPPRFGELNPPSDQG